jgi:hypothetical protein
MPNHYAMRCPACGRDDAIEINAQSWRVLRSDGTERGPSFDGYTWMPRTETHCIACGHEGTAADFSAPDDPSSARPTSEPDDPVTVL